MKFKKEPTKKMGYQIKLDAITKRHRSLDLTEAAPLTINKEFLSYLISEGELEVFKACYEAQGKDFVWSATENELLFDAIDHDRAAFVRYILEVVKERDSASLKIFITAKRLPKNKKLPFCLESPLMVAASRGNREIVQLLVQYGANIRGSRVLRSSVIKRVTDTFFLEGDPIRHVRGQYEYPVYRAIANNHQDIVAYFLSLNTEINPMVLCNLLLESIHYGHLDLYRFLLEKGASLPKNISRVLAKDKVAIVAITFSPPTPFSIFLTGASLTSVLNEAEQKELAEGFYNLSPENTLLSYGDIESAFSIHHNYPHILWYAIQKFMDSVGEKDQRMYLKMFLCLAIKNLSDNHILRSFQNKDPSILIHKLEGSTLAISRILKEHVGKYREMSEEERLHLKRVLDFMLTWTKDFSEKISLSALQNHLFWNQSKEKSIQKAISSFETLFEKLKQEIESREAEDVKDDFLKITEISFSC